jgi:nucleotide-binding universal stress UspA family protein
MTVVVGYVPGASGLLAVREAAQQALWRETDLVVVNVIDAAGFARPTAADEKELDAVAVQLTSDGVRFTVRQVNQETTLTAQTLLAIATETSAELIVVGIKRTSAVAKAVLGSTAQRVLLGAHCPVLSVHADHD